MGSPSPNSSLNQHWTMDPPPRPSSVSHGSVRQPAASLALCLPPRVSQRCLHSQVAVVWRKDPLINLPKKPVTASVLNQNTAFPACPVLLTRCAGGHMQLCYPAVQLDHAGLLISPPSPPPALLFSPLLENSCLSLQPTVFKTRGSSKNSPKVLKFPLLLGS